MDDALLVRRFEGVGDLLRDRQRLIERDGSARDALRQVLPSTSSITSARTPVDFSSPWMCAILGWFSDASVLRFAREPGQSVGVTGE